MPSHSGRVRRSQNSSTSRFAQSEIARLEELRLGATEDRFEADLDLGRHRELVAELEAFVAREPLRERARGQLMLALYRSGRQAQALHVFQAGRRVLADDLGVEPSETLQDLERRILRQDPSLDGPAAGPRPLLTLRGEPVASRWVILAGALALGAVVGVAGWTVIRQDAPVDAAGVAMLDPATGNHLATVPLGTAPSLVAIGEGGVWVVDADDRTLTQLDAATRSVRRTFSTASTPTDVAVGAGAVWIGNAAESSSGHLPGSVLPVSVDRLDPVSGDVVARIPLPTGPPGSGLGAHPGFSRRHVAATTDAVWVIGPDQRVSRIDPRTNTIVATIPELEAENIAVGEGEVWVTQGGDAIEIDPTRNIVGGRSLITEFALSDIAIGAGSVWGADPGAGKVWRVGTGPGSTAIDIAVAPWVAAVAFGEGGLWATSEIADEVHRIDPRTNQSALVGQAPAPRGVDAADRSVWVTVARSPSADAALPEALCSPVHFDGPGEPDLLMTSSLSMEGDSKAVTGPLVDGIRFVLEQRGFEAGAHRVGFQACDTATAQSGKSDFFRCGSNAKVLARNLKVVGVIGAFESFCSELQLPITNVAPGGPLAMVSPSNTDDYITSDGEHYPSGVRNYVRIALANRFQGTAQVRLAHDLDASSLFLLWNHDLYEAIFVDEIRAAAASSDIRLVGDTQFDSAEMDPVSVAAEVARAEPGAVIIIGGPDVGTGALIRELRAALDSVTPIILPDSFSLADELIELTGPAAQGLYVTLYGIPNSELPPRGRTFLQDFERSRGAPAGIDLGAAYGAQAAEILLDAIGRSDGTRGSVSQEVFRTRIDDGILGSISFDENGDLIEGPTTVLRLVGDDFEVDRVVMTGSAS